MKKKEMIILAIILLVKIQPNLATSVIPSPSYPSSVTTSTSERNSGLKTIQTAIIVTGGRQSCNEDSSKNLEERSVKSLTFNIGQVPVSTIH